MPSTRFAAAASGALSQALGEPHACLEQGCLMRAEHAAQRFVDDDDASVVRTL